MIKLTKCLLRTLPFKSRARQNVSDGFKRFKFYNSPTTIATELFKPSTDSASLLVSIKKNIYLIWMRGFLLVKSQTGPQPAWDTRRREEFFERGPIFLNYVQ